MQVAINCIIHTYAYRRKSIQPRGTGNEPLPVLLNSQFCALDNKGRCVPSSLDFNCRLIAAQEKA